MKMTKELRRDSRNLYRLTFTGGKLDRAKMAKIVETVIRTKPRGYVELLDAYHRLVRLDVEKRHAVIESATSFNQATGDQIVENLKSKYGSELTTEFKVNPELIGGIRIKIGSDVWDGSVRERLNRLREQL